MASGPGSGVRSRDVTRKHRTQIAPSQNERIVYQPAFSILVFREQAVFGVESTTSFRSVEHSSFSRCIMHMCVARKCYSQSERVLFGNSIAMQMHGSHVKSLRTTELLVHLLSPYHPRMFFPTFPTLPPLTTHRILTPWHEGLSSRSWIALNGCHVPMFCRWHPRFRGEEGPQVDAKIQGIHVSCGEVWFSKKPVRFQALNCLSQPL